MMKMTPRLGPGAAFYFVTRCNIPLIAALAWLAKVDFEEGCVRAFEL
jgi:hypothetical protein